MLRTIFGALMALAMLAAAGTSLAAAEWSRFRGPNGTGVTSADALPVEFGPGNGSAWATPVPPGRSSPVLTADRVFLTGLDGEGPGSRLVTLAIARHSGEVLWRRGVERAHLADLYHGSDSASSTPATDGSNVYVFFHELGLLSYDGEGNERWRVELGPFRNYYGIAASPIVAGDTVYMVLDQVQGSYVLAVDAATGRQRWRRERPLRIESYATPVLLPDEAAPTELLVLGSRWIDAYALDTGEPVWSLNDTGVGPVASPALAGDLLFVTAPDHAAEPPPPFSDILAEYDSDGDGVLARDELEGYWMHAHFGFVDIDGDGSVTTADYEMLTREMVSDSWGVYGIRLGGEAPEVLWNVRQSVPYIPSPLLYDGVLYAVKDTIVTSLDPTTGEVLKRGRLARQKTSVNASPVAADGKVYLATTDGKVAVLDAGPEWEILAINELGEEIHATPAIADGRLFVRTSDRLYCFAASTSDPGDATGEEPGR